MVTDIDGERMERQSDDIVDTTISTTIRYSDLQYQIRRLIRRLGNDPDIAQRDWTDAVANAIMESLVDEQLRSTRWIACEHKGQLNIRLYEMSYEIWLACEFARHQSSGEKPHPESFMREVAKLQNNQHEDTVGDIAYILCRVLIIIHQGRNSYDYAAMDKALTECSNLLPLCNPTEFRMLECFRIVASAGKSRDSKADTCPDVTELETLAEGILLDRGQGGGPYVEHALMVLISAMGHRMRSGLVSEILAQPGQESGTSVAADSWIDWMIDRLGRIDQRWKDSKDDDSGNPVKAMVHDLHYYRYFAYHVRAIATATQMEVTLQRMASGSDNADNGSDNADNGLKEMKNVLKKVGEYYARASDEIEWALQKVPSSNYTRWLYYNVTAETLEHETNLRIAMLEHEQRMAESVGKLYKSVSAQALKQVNDRVEREAEKVGEELRDRMADISTRIVEILGVFLAIVAIVATTIISSTAGDLSLTQRLIILVVGGMLPIAYFTLLRSIIYSPGRAKIGFFPRLRNRRGEASREDSNVGDNPGDPKSSRS